ncbi:MAG: hypothetical protein ACYC7E_03100 [Armatimonadota bacterium]
MTELNEKYPLQETRIVADKYIELRFHVYVQYGSADRNEQGERLEGVVDREGVLHNVPWRAEQWEDVCPGVQVKTDSSETHFGGGRGSQTKETFVKIERNACPVRLLAKHVTDYSSEDFYEGNTRPYAIQLVAEV